MKEDCGKEKIMKNFLKNIILFIGGAIFGIGTSTLANYQAVFKEKDEQVVKQQERAVRNLAIVDVLAQWLEIRQEGKMLANYFETKGYRKIAIYGMHYLGEALLRELRDTSIEVNYAIDRNAKNISCDIPCVDLRGTLEAVDVIVVTPITSFFEIEDELSKKVSCPIISIEDVIFDMQ